MTGLSTDTRYSYLRPGNWYFGPVAGIIRTILGSCVAVTMFHKRSGQSAICHAVMPLCDQNGSCSVCCAERSRYTDCIVRAMAGLFFERGVKAKEIEVKLFGGSNGLGGAGDQTRPGVGKQNVTQARKALQEKNLILKASDVGGSDGRKLLLNTNSGEVMVKKLTGSGVYRTSDFQ